MVLVGSSVAVSQLLLDYPLLTGQAIRYAVAAAILFLAARTGPRPTPRELGVIAMLAFLGMAGFNACILFGLKHAEPAAIGTVIGAAPLGLALLGSLLQKQRPNPRRVVAAAIVVGGTILVEGTGRTNAFGVTAAVGALIGEIAFSLLAVLVIPRLGAILVSAYSCALATPQLLLGGLILGEYPQWRMPTLGEAGALAYLALFMTVIAFVAWFTGLNRLGVPRAGMLVGIMPLATLATAAIMAGSFPQPVQILGVATVAAGLFAGLTTAPEQTVVELRA